MSLIGYFFGVWAFFRRTFYRFSMRSLAFWRVIGIECNGIATTNVWLASRTAGTWGRAGRSMGKWNSSNVPHPHFTRTSKSSASAALYSLASAKCKFTSSAKRKVLRGEWITYINRPCILTRTTLAEVGKNACDYRSSFWQKWVGHQL